MELEAKRARLIEQMQRMLTAAETRDDPNFSDEEQEQYDLLEAELKAVNEQIERRKKLKMLLESGQTANNPLARQAQSGGMQMPAVHLRQTKDTPEAIMCRYIRSRGLDMGAAREMHAASLDQYRNGDDIQNAELQQAFREERASNDTIMNITTAADGGNLVPVGHYNRIIARKDEGGLAAVLPIMPIPGVGTTVNVPVDDESGGEFVLTGEQVDAHTNVFDRDAPPVGKVQMTLVKYTKKIELTDELLIDNDSNLMQWLEYRVGLGLQKTDNALIVTEALANGTAAITLGAAAAATVSDIPRLIYAQADGYEDNGYWVMRKATEGAYRQLTGNNFQLTATPMGADRGNLWGFPVATTSKMPAIGGGYKSILFGDFSFMGVRRMPGLTLLVDPYTVDGLLILKYYYRVVFKVLQAAAIVYGTHPTA